VLSTDIPNSYNIKQNSLDQWHDYAIQRSDEVMSRGYRLIGAVVKHISIFPSEAA
jgi:hypothetical protein